MYGTNRTSRLRVLVTTAMALAMLLAVSALLMPSPALAGGPVHVQPKVCRDWCPTNCPRSITFGGALCPLGDCIDCTCTYYCG